MRIPFRLRIIVDYEVDTENYDTDNPDLIRKQDYLNFIADPESVGNAVTLYMEEGKAFIAIEPLQ